MAKKLTEAEIGAAQRAMSKAQCRMMLEREGKLKEAEARNRRRAAQRKAKKAK